MPASRSIALLTFAAAIFSVESFTSSIHSVNRFQSTTSLEARRKSLRKTVAAGNNARGVNSMGGEMEPTKKTNWVPVSGLTSMADLPQEENVVKLVDTMADQLINGATNPTGAVSVVNYEGKTYCFASSCTCCQIPLAKAKVLPPNEETGGVAPRLSCDFCKATYNIRTGERIENADKPGLLGGVVTGLFSKSEKKPLPVYDLGEKTRVCSSIFHRKYFITRRLSIVSTIWS